MGFRKTIKHYEVYVECNPQYVGLILYIKTIPIVTLTAIAKITS